MVIVKFFYERSDEEYRVNNLLWDENRSRMIPYKSYKKLAAGNKKRELRYLSHFKELIAYNIEESPIKPTIMAIRFQHSNIFTDDEIVSSILRGNGIPYGCGDVWLPEEIWIYEIQR